MSTTKDTLKEFLREGTSPAIIERYIALEDIAEDNDFGVLDNNVVVVDTEATGLSVTKDELIQIAAARIINGKIEDWYVTFVDPGIEISEDIEHLTHISNEDVAGAPSPDEALRRLVDFCGDAVMLAHNATFDKSFLTKHASGYPLLDNLWIDSLDLVRIVFPRLTSHRLIDLSKAFGVVESTHRADDDVATTCIIYRLALAGISQMPYNLIKVIANLASVDMWSTSYVFKQMLNVVPIFDKDVSTDNIVSENIDNVDIFGEPHTKVNTVGLLRAIRTERFVNIQTQEKFDVELANSDLYPSNSNLEIKAQNALQFPTSDELNHDFSNDGLLGKIYSDYEERKEQKEMSNYVLKAFRDSKKTVIEAGTGVGKSMAYLIPAIKIAKENQVIVGIATKTNSLLDQLIYHELPALKEQIGDLVYSSLKGAKHYICLRKASILASQSAKIVKFKGEEFCNAPSVAGLLSYIEQTVYDDCDGVKINGRALPNAAYTCGSHECYHGKCPFFNHGCFVHGARRMAKNSDIVVTNHSMLLCDLKSNHGLMPPIRYWIIDEAHGIESEARKAFSSNVLAQTLLDFSNNLSSESAKFNVFVRAIKNIDSSNLEVKDDRNIDFNSQQEDKTLIFGLMNKCKSISKDFSILSANYADNICLLLNFADKNSYGYEFSNIWINNKIRESEQFNKLFNYAKEWMTCADNLLTQANKLLLLLQDYKGNPIVVKDISALLFDIKECLSASDVIFINNSDKFVYSTTINNKNIIKFDKLSAEPYTVSEQLNDSLYSSCNSVVFTSATLALGDNFESFKDSVGLDSDTLECQLDSSFDYYNNMKVFVCNDMPDPNSVPYVDALSDFLTELHIAGRGSILSLFTNRRQMEKAFEVVSENIKPNGLRLLVQKWGLSVKSVKDEFVNNESLSLFALKSFWEGFDAPGSTLKAVVVCKLPFVPATDPLNRERCDREKDAWFKYSLPSAIIECKQAVGRLIRKSDDKGYVVLCDSRLTQKHYGNLFLKSMPSKNINILKCSDIIEEVKKLEF